MGTALRPLRALLPGVVLLFSSGDTHSQELLWPLPLKPALSSTFGESRSTGIHLGIDLKTWGKTGFEVRAPVDGYVMRLRTSPWGFGRALYLKLKDGRILVFAHLSSFATRIGLHVAEAQQEQQRYSVDIWLEADKLVIRRGDLIGRTGASGAGPPHLHLEVRDEDNVPLNPLENGFRVPDTIPPTIRAIGLLPIDATSRIDGRHEPHIQSVRWDASSGRFESGHIPSVYGRIGVALLDYDRMDAAPNPLASHQLHLEVDGRPYFAVTYNRASYAKTHQIFLDRSRLKMGKGKSNFANLFLRPGNRLGFYTETAKHHGVLHCGWGAGALAKGEHVLEAKVLDRAGNTSRASIRIRVNAPPEILIARLIEEENTDVVEVELGDEDDTRLDLALHRSDDGEEWVRVASERVPLGLSSFRRPHQSSLFRLTAADESGAQAMVTVASLVEDDQGEPELVVSSVAYRDGVDLRIRSSQILAAAPLIEASTRDQVVELIARQEDLRTYTAQVPLGEESIDAGLTVHIAALSRSGRKGSVVVDFNLTPLDPDVPRQLRFAGALLTVPQSAAYERVVPQVSFFHPETDGELVATGIGYQFEPEGTSFDRKVNLQISYPSSGVEPGKLGIYRQLADGRWAMIGNEVHPEAATIGCDIRRFSRFALLADLIPPTILEVYPAPGASLRMRKPQLRFRFKEEGSGIAREEDAEIRLDGRRVISELDPDASTVSFLVRENLSPGKHRMLVRIADACGNEASSVTEFEVE